MTQANPDFAGRTYPPGEPLLIDAVKVREFAQATGNTHPAHHDAAAARSLGYRDIAAPPTFLVSLAQAAEAQYINDPDASIDFSRVVHSDESFQLHRPIIAGDELTPTLTVVAVRSVGPHSMVSTRVDFADTDGAEVASVGSSLVIRGEEA